MENNEVGVEFEKEPGVESRFGFKKEKGSLSSRTIKISAGLTLAGLTAIMLISAPDHHESDDSPGIATPETSDINRASEGIPLNSYSAADEDARLKVQAKKAPKKAFPKLAGVQKIDRVTAADISPGSMVKAVLLIGASNGPVRVEVKEALREHGETLVPAGAILWGKGTSSEDRLFIHFSKMILRDGQTQDIQADAADGEDQTVGLKGSRVGRYAARYATAVGLNFVGGMAEGLQAREIVGTQVITKPDAKNALLNGASRATLEMGNEEMEKIRSTPTVIQVDAGKEIFVMFGASD
jgi:hypothetical protein